MDDVRLCEFDKEEWWDVLCAARSRYETKEELLMNNETRHALLGSICKWEQVSKNHKEEHGSTDCPLCRLFLGNYCQGCPVADRTGSGGCIGTPNERWSRLKYREGNRFPYSEEQLAIAREELDFLRSLL